MSGFIALLVLNCPNSWTGKYRPCDQLGENVLYVNDKYINRYQEFTYMDKKDKHTGCIYWINSDETLYSAFDCGTR